LPSLSCQALDKGLAGSSSSDQRGELRTADWPLIANAAGGDGTDVGAVELHPTPLQVTNTNDSGTGSVREAITDANGLPGRDVIAFAPGVTGTINLQSELPALTGYLEIDGPGLAQLTVRRNTGGNYRIFTIETGAKAKISGLTITNGSSDLGGGVRNSGELLLERVALRSNSATAQGGGAYNEGTLTIKSSTVSGNSAQGDSGGIASNNILSAGSLTVLDSTISGNDSTGGPAGVNQQGGFLTMRGSTVTGNVASAQDDPYGAGGVGVYAGDGLIADSTIAGNTHGADGAANLVPLSVAVQSTIIANPLGGGPDCLPRPAPDVWPADAPLVTSQGFNLESADTCGLSAPSDQTDKDPQLGPLADNGGPTQTMALPVSSPAVDAGSSTSGPNDQRGFARTVDQPGTPNAPGGNASDIGAFELQVQPVVSTPSPPAQPAPTKKKCKKGRKLKKGKCVKKKKRR
jgi:hypothetical protein